MKRTSAFKYIKGYYIQGCSLSSVEIFKVGLIYQNKLGSTCNGKPGFLRANGYLHAYAIST